VQVGLLPLVGNRENLPAFEGWAGRAQRAQRNMLENLIIFAALVLMAQFAGKTNVATRLSSGAALPMRRLMSSGFHGFALACGAFRS
jgi:uncharacterized MAPEG superfamily protein